MKTSAESMLVSAVLNSGDAHAASSHGITPEMMHGYREEYEWVLDFSRKFGEPPSVEKLKIVFPSFPYSEAEIDPRWAASEVQEKYARQRLAKAIMRGTEMMNRDDVRGAYDEFAALSYAEASARPANLLVDPGYLEDYTSIDEIRAQVPWQTVQAATGGIGAGELWYLLGRQGHGKTALGLDIAVTAAMKGQRVLFYALEMTKRQLQVRAHALMGHKLGWGNKIDAYKMLHRQYDYRLYQKLLAEIGEVMPAELHIHDLTMGFAKPSTVMGRAGEYDLVVIDHIGLMRTDDNKRSVDDWRFMASISNGLKEVTGAKLARILGMVQINREGDGFGWRPPPLKTAAGSDAIGQDADVAITMRRYGKYAAVASIEKNRHGEGGKLFFTNYLANTGNFDEITRTEADDIKDADDE